MIDTAADLAAILAAGYIRLFAARIFQKTRRDAVSQAQISSIPLEFSPPKWPVVDREDARGGQ